MRRVPIVDVVSPRGTSDDTNKLRISDEDIDKIFNSNCGSFEEVKKTDVKQNPVQPSPPKAEPIVETIKEAKKETKQSPPKASLVEESSKDSKKDLISKPEADKKNEPSPAKKAAVEVPKAQSPVSSPKTTKQPSTEAKAEILKTSQTEKIENTLKEIEMPASTTEVSTLIKRSRAILNLYFQRALPPAPTGTAQFHVTWKELSAPQKYLYLKSIEVSSLCKILGAGFDSETFADLLHTVQDYYVPNKEPTTAAVLLEVSKNDEFTILAMLMSAEEKKSKLQESFSLLVFIYSTHYSTSFSGNVYFQCHQELAQQKLGGPG